MFRRFAVLVTLCALLPAARSDALPGPGGEFEEPTSLGLLKLSGGPWFTSGMARWQTSFPLTTQFAKNDLGFGSTLEFNDSHDLLWLWKAELRPIKYVGIEMQYADSSSVGGVSRDHDWLNAPGFIITAVPSNNVYVTPHQTDMSLSQSTLTGRTTYAALNVYGRVLDFDSADDEVNVRQVLDVGLGYDWYDDRYRMKNLTQITSTGDFINTPPPGSYAGQDSTFHFRWTGLKFAFREETTTWHRSVHLASSFGVSPFMSYRGEGYWNMRAGSDFAAGPPSFRQSASGTLMEFDLGLSYTPVSWFAANLGYMLVYLKSRAGTITNYLADGTTTQQDLDGAWNERKGFLMGLSLKY